MNTPKPISQTIQNFRKYDKSYVIYFTSLLISFLIFKNHFLDNASNETARYIAYTVNILLIAICFPVTYKSLPKALKILLGSLTILFTIYLMLSTTGIASTDLTYLQFFEVNTLKWIAVICGILSFWRIGFSLFLFSYVHLQKGFYSSFFTIKISRTDYLPLVEAGVFFFFAILMFHLLKNKFKLNNDNKNELHILEFTFLIGVAVHFANYFYSGLKKIYIGDFSLSHWATNNETQNLIITASQSGQLPISYFPETADWIFHHFSQIVVTSNFLILIGQLLAIVAICRIRTAQLLTFFYDITHAVIFFVSGIFFYKWIVYNLAIIAALNTLRNKKMHKTTILSLLLILICAPLIFFTAKLGWYDTPLYNDEHFEAVYKDGERYRVPSNYFLNTSVTHAQQRINMNRTGAFDLTRTYGITTDINTHSNVKSCPSNMELKTSSVTFSTQLHEDVQNRLEKLQQFYIQAESKRDIPYQYDLFPHHIYSMPWEFSEFQSRYKKDIIGYNYVIEIMCLEFKNGKSVAYPYKRHEVFFDVR